MESSFQAEQHLDRFSCCCTAHTLQWVTTFFPPKKVPLPLAGLGAQSNTCLVAWAHLSQHSKRHLVSHEWNRVRFYYTEQIFSEQHLASESEQYLLLIFYVLLKG